MKYKHIFFDLDRTLWDFEANSKETFNEIFYKHNLDSLCSFSDFHKEYRKINDQLWAQYRLGKITKENLSWQRFYQTMEAFGKKDEKTAKLMSDDYITISPTKTKMFPYVHEVLDYLSKKYTLHIVTNGFKEVQYKKINNSNIANYFTMIFTSEEVGCNKPNPDFFSFVLNETGAKDYESIVIGDDLEVDIKGAKNMKIDAIWFNPNYMKGDFKPDYEISSLEEINNIL